MGLAIIAEKTEDEWTVHAREGISSHEELVWRVSCDHDRKDLEEGTSPYLKFELWYPDTLHDDIPATIQYPPGWVVGLKGKRRSCAKSRKAVRHYLSENTGLMEFNNRMLQHASLSGAKMIRADLRDAILVGTFIEDTDLFEATMTHAE